MLAHSLLTCEVYYQYCYYLKTGWELISAIPEGQDMWQQAAVMLAL